MSETLNMDLRSLHDSHVSWLKEHLVGETIILFKWDDMDTLEKEN